MNENNLETVTSLSSDLSTRENIIFQLQELLVAGNYDEAKLLLEPSQPVDIADAIGSLPLILQALAFRLLKKNEAIEVYEYLDPIVQQTLLDRLRSGEVLEIVEKMSPDDRVQLFDELPAKVVRKFLSALSPGERKVTAELLGDEDDYFQSSLFTIARRRILWLLILVLANGLTTKVIAMNDQILKEIVLLAAFIPLLIGTGGNVGAQSSTVVIRGLSTQKLKSIGAIKAVFKEAITGALLGVLMMLVVFPFAWWQGEGPLIASAVAISLISITTLAATTGAILPLLFDRMKLDPALMSSPFITTVTDIAGVFIYLSTAKWLLSSSII